MKRIPLLFLTILTVNMSLYALFWLASEHLSFAFSGETIEERSVKISSGKGEHSTFKGNFWHSYTQWLGISLKKLDPLFFENLESPQVKTHYDRGGSVIGQTWRVLLKEEQGRIGLYSSPAFPVNASLSSLPPAHEISEWKKQKNVQIQKNPQGWKAVELKRSGILQGDWGDSLSFSRPVSNLIASRLPLTFLIGFMSILIAYPLALPLAYLLLRQRSPLVSTIKSFGFFFFSAPHVILGLCLLWLFAWKLKWLPLQALPWWELSSSPFRFLVSLIAPTLTLAIPVLTTNSLLISQRLTEEREKDYILFARAKGLSHRRIAFSHLIRVSLAPLVVRLKNALLLLFSGSMVVEKLFGLVGIGQLSLEALLNNDLALALALANLISGIQILGQFLSEGILVLWYEKNSS